MINCLRRNNLFITSSRTDICVYSISGPSRDSDRTKEGLASARARLNSKFNRVFHSNPIFLVINQLENHIKPRISKISANCFLVTVVSLFRPTFGMFGLLWCTNSIFFGTVNAGIN